MEKVGFIDVEINTLTELSGSDFDGIQHIAFELSIANAENRYRQLMFSRNVLNRKLGIWYSSHVIWSFFIQ